MMKFILMLLSLLILSAGCSPAPGKPDHDFVSSLYKDYPALKDRRYSVEKVQRVVDGDTFVTGTGEKVRLIGVNTPESLGTVQPFGKEASAYTKKQLAGKTVYLFSDAGNTDKYGRLLRYVFLEGEALMYNEKLVREGYANPMTVPPNVLYADRFVQAEKDARSQKKGLWGKHASDGSKPSSAVFSGSSCEDPQIKGNINSKNEKIYHLPGTAYYDKTVPEALFCTESEARKAGFRKAGG
ncbi:thermonuclease family protein [Paenibacillus sp. CC-CFT747]|nr:thermonuclease family protein [Paenibacillus sp. CC-CFT747]